MGVWGTVLAVAFDTGLASPAWVAVGGVADTLLAVTSVGLAAAGAVVADVGNQPPIWAMTPILAIVTAVAATRIIGCVVPIGLTVLMVCMVRSISRDDVDDESTQIR